VKTLTDLILKFAASGIGLRAAIVEAKAAQAAALAAPKKISRVAVRPA